MHQLRMNQNLNQLTDAFSKTSSKSAFSKLLDAGTLPTESDDQAQQQPSSGLNENSSTAEFRNYLDDLKRNYMAKLTYSCPTKQPQISSLSQDKLLTSTGLKKGQTTRRSLYFNEQPAADETKKAQLLYSKILPVPCEPAKTRSVEDNEEEEDVEMDKLTKDGEGGQPELSRTQITSRLIQVREYLKHAYSMISSMHLSNDSINQTAQINKLHTMIDHLKDQEKGYMDLLNSFSKYQQLTDSIAKEKKKQALPSNNKSVTMTKDVLDLSVLNDQEDEILDLYSVNKKGSKAAETPANSLADSFNASGLYNPNRFAQLDDSLKSTGRRLSE